MGCSDPVDGVISPLAVRRTGSAVFPDELTWEDDNPYSKNAGAMTSIGHPRTPVSK